MLEDKSTIEYDTIIIRDIPVINKIDPITKIAKNTRFANLK